MPRWPLFDGGDFKREFAWVAEVRHLTDAAELPHAHT